MRPRIVEQVNTIFNVSVGEYIVPSPASLYVLGILLVTVVFVHRCQRSGLDRYHALGFSFWSIVGGMIGARVFYLIQNLDLLFSDFNQILDVSGGTVSWGAYLGGTIGFISYLTFHKQPILQYADVFSSCVALGPFIGRWSCYFNGCCFGKITNLPWAINFPQDSIPWSAHVQAMVIDESAIISLPVHPVQIYHSIIGLILFLFMSWYWMKWKHIPGKTFFSYWIIYALTRFILDYLRDDASREMITLFSTSQTMALLIITLSIFLLVKVTKDYRSVMITNF